MLTPTIVIQIEEEGIELPEDQLKSLKIERE
jgi:hypothetical protein